MTFRTTLRLGSDLEESESLNDKKVYMATLYRNEYPERK